MAAVHMIAYHVKTSLPDCVQLVRDASMQKYCYIVNLCSNDAVVKKLLKPNCFVRSYQLTYNC